MRNAVVNIAENLKLQSNSRSTISPSPMPANVGAGDSYREQQHFLTDCVHGFKRSKRVGNWTD